MPKPKFTSHNITSSHTTNNKNLIIETKTMMIRLVAPLISSPLKLRLKPSNPKNQTLITSPHFHLRSTATMSTSVIEHLVLFKVKPDTTSHTLSTMIDGLNSLSHQIPQLLHLSVGPILRNRSSTQFTHLLHSRYSSKDDLATYAAHPSHVSVVKNDVLPVCDEIMSVDWIADDLDPLKLSPGLALRFTLLKVKDEGDKEEVLRIVKGVSDGVDKVVQSSIGENFSPARAKGFGVASLAVFEGIQDLEEANEVNKEVLESYKENVRDYVDGVVDVEYVIPSSSSTQSANL